jgi:hypothetical protein
MGSLGDEWQPKFAYFEAGDFNGDGIDDLFRANYSAGGYLGYFYISDGK